MENAIPSPDSAGCLKTQEICHNLPSVYNYCITYFKILQGYKQKILNLFTFKFQVHIYIFLIICKTELFQLKISHKILHEYK